LTTTAGIAEAWILILGFPHSAGHCAAAARFDFSRLMAFCRRVIHAFAFRGANQATQIQPQARRDILVLLIEEHEKEE